MGDGTVTWSALRAEAEHRLESSGVDTAPQEPRWIVEEATGECYEAVAGMPATERAVAHFDAMTARRERGEPIQYALGHWSFRTLDLLVDRRALIPRPETEVVAGLVIDEIDRREGPRTVADLGTGSGAIALAVAVECAGPLEVWASDESAEALEVARANTAGLGRRGARVRLAEGSWYRALPPRLRGAVDVVVSNPPYVATGARLPGEVEGWEPAAALRSGPDGLDDLRCLVAGAGEWLVPGGLLILELDPGQVEAVTHLARVAGLVDRRVHTDLAGADRALTARRPELS